MEVFLGLPRFVCFGGLSFNSIDLKVPEITVPSGLSGSTLVTETLGSAIESLGSAAEILVSSTDSFPCRTRPEKLSTGFAAETKEMDSSTSGSTFLFRGDKLDLRRLVPGLMKSTT